MVSYCFCICLQLNMGKTNEIVIKLKKVALQFATGKGEPTKIVNTS